MRKVKVIDKPQVQEPVFKRVRLEQWFKVGDRLHGFAYGHPRFPDGTEVTTSRVLYIAPPVAQTQNTLYELGQPAGSGS